MNRIRLFVEDFKKSNIVDRLALLGSVCIYIGSLIPVFILSFYDRMCLDDVSYGTYTHHAWESTHSIIQVLLAACQKTYETYFVWQGTWFTLLLFPLHPAIFKPEAYCLVPWIAVFLLTLAMLCFASEIFVRRFGLTLVQSASLGLILTFMMLQFNPEDTHVIFWWTGIIHYTLPLAMAIVSIALVSRYMRMGYKRTFIGMIVVMALLGGTNYLAAFMSLLGILFFGLIYLIQNKGKFSSRLWTLFIPVILECIGLLISALAPGNFERSDMAINLQTILVAVGKSFRDGTISIGYNLLHKPVTTLIFVIVAIYVLYIFETNTQSAEYKHPLCFALYIYASRCMMYWPQRFAGGHVSPGGDNTYYQSYVLMLCLWIIYIVGWAKGILKNRQRDSFATNKSRVIISGIVCGLCAFLCVTVFKADLKASAGFRSFDMLRSGRARLFVEETDFERWLLTDVDSPSRKIDSDGQVSVTVPSFGYDQTPLLYSPVDLQPTGWMNEALAQYYGVDTVYGMLSDEWVELYHIDTPDKVIWEQYLEN